MSLPNSKFTMSGTEGTGQYVGVTQTSRGTLAVREYCPGEFRVRVEPRSRGADVIGRRLTRAAGWKQPGDQLQTRFSKTAIAANLASVIREATDALGVGTLKSTELDHVSAIRYVARKAGLTVPVWQSRATVLGRITATTGQ